MGLEVNDEVDERYHVEKSTLAACGYINKLYERFGSWTDAAAAYNIGPTAYDKILNDQEEDSYYDLNLTSETSRYIFRLMAFKEIMTTPSNYGFYLRGDQLYEPLENFYEVLVDVSIDSWGEFAKKHGTTYRILKLYNPWLRDNKLTVVNNKYQIRIPN